MKKFFLIPLLTLFTCVSAWGATVEVSTFAELKSAIGGASDGDVIKLTTSISGSNYYAMPSVGFTIDLNGKDLEITGSGITFSIYYMSGSAPVIIKNGRILSTGTASYPITYSASAADCILENVEIQSGTKAAIKADVKSLTIQGTNTIPSIELGGNLPMINETSLTTSIIASGYNLNLTNNGSFTFGANTVYSQNKAPTITNNGTIAIEAGAAFSELAWNVVSEYKNPAHVAEKWALSNSGVLGKKVFASVPAHVAKIGEEEYASFDAAFLDARLSGESKNIQLLSDANLLNYFSFGDYNVDITVDLNNHTLAMGNNYIYQSPLSGTPSQKLAFENGTITSNATAIFKLSPSKAFIPELTLNNVTLTNTYNQSNALISKRGVGIETTGKAKIALLGTTTGTVRLTSLYNLSVFDLNNEAQCHVYVLGLITSTTAAFANYIDDNTLLDKFGATNTWWEIQQGFILPAIKDNYISHITGTVAETTTDVGPTGSQVAHYKITESGATVIATVNGVNYYNFFDALDASSETYPAILQTDVYVGGLSALTGQNRYVNLNGHTIEQAGLMLEMNRIENGKLHFLGNGTVTTTAPFYIIGSSDASAVDYSVLEIAAGVTVTYDASFENYAIWVAENASNKAYGVRVDLAGTVNSNVGGAYINGNIKTASEHAPIFNISGTLNAAHSGIYAAGYGIWNISGTVNGNDATGIGIKAGKLNITNNAVVYGGATSEFERVDAFGNGMNVSGATLQIESNGSYGGNMEIAISGNATLSSANNTYAIYEYVDKFDAPTKVNSIAVTGGKFQGGILISQALAAKGGFVSGGKWSKDVSAHIKAGENLSLMDNTDDDKATYPFIVAVPAPEQAEDYAEITNVDPVDPEKSNNAVLTNAASESEASSYTSETVGEEPDVIATKETNPVVVSENTDVVATEAAPVVEVKKVTVSNDAQLTVTEGATLNVGSGAIHLDEEATTGGLTVEAGAAVVVEGLIYGATEKNFVIEAEEGKTATILFSPETEFIPEDHPMASYKFTSKARYRDGVYSYQRFGVPTFDGITTMTWEGDVLTSLDRYNNEIGKWEHIYPAAMGRYEIEGKAFQCYNMTVNKDEEVTYTFTGKLMGNQDTDLEFVTGWNCYANCYTAPINTASLLNQINTQFGEGVSGAIYFYKRNAENATDWEAITMGDFRTFGEGYLEAHDVKEIAPMRAFILNLRNGDSAEGTISYVDNIYNPFMNPTPKLAPKAKNGNATGVVLYVSDGKNSDKLSLYQNDELSDEFDNGWDADKFDNGYDFSIYCMLGDSKMSAFGSDDLSNKVIAFDTKVAGEFTLSVEIAVGDPVVLYDNVEKKELELTTGATYTFSAEAINDPARFTINASDPTAIENTEAVGTTSKYIKDGQLYIRRAGSVYTVQGQNVK